MDPVGLRLFEENLWHFYGRWAQVYLDRYMDYSHFATSHTYRISYLLGAYLRDATIWFYALRGRHDAERIGYPLIALLDRPEEMYRELLERSNQGCQILWRPAPTIVYRPYTNAPELETAEAVWYALLVDIDWFDASALSEQRWNSEETQQLLSRLHTKIVEDLPDDGLIWRSNPGNAYTIYRTGNHAHVMLWGYWGDLEEDREARAAYRDALDGDRDYLPNPKQAVRAPGFPNAKTGKIVEGCVYRIGDEWLAFDDPQDYVIARRRLEEEERRRREPPPPRPPTKRLRFRWIPGQPVEIFDDEEETPADSTSSHSDPEPPAPEPDAGSGSSDSAKSTPANTADAETGDDCYLWRLETQSETVASRMEPFGVQRVDENRWTLTVCTTAKPEWMGRRSRATLHAGAVHVEVFRVHQAHARIAQPDEVERIIFPQGKVELEWGVAKAMRAASRSSELLAIIWLNHLKRTAFPDGTVPYSEAKTCLIRELRYSEQYAYQMLSKLQKKGILIRIRGNRLIVPSWSSIASRIGASTEMVIFVDAGEVRTVGALKSCLASLPGSHSNPQIKRDIAQQLGVSVETVRRNRKGRERRWCLEQWVDTYQTREQAVSAQRTQLHPYHLVPLHLCGFRMAPSMVRNRWALRRSSAAQILDLVCLVRPGKTRKVRSVDLRVKGETGATADSDYLDPELLREQLCERIPDTDTYWRGHRQTPDFRTSGGVVVNGFDRVVGTKSRGGLDDLAEKMRAAARTLLFGGGAYENP